MGHYRRVRDRHDVRRGPCGFRALSYGCILLRATNTITDTNPSTNTNSCFYSYSGALTNGYGNRHSYRYPDTYRHSYRYPNTNSNCDSCTVHH